MHLESLDFAVVAIYAVSLLLLAQWVSREKAGHEKDTKDYFLAGRALPWWAIGASLIAANISAEQIIGMSGSAYLMGVAIASYEWMAALTLLIVGKFNVAGLHLIARSHQPGAAKLEFIDLLGDFHDADFGGHRGFNLAVHGLVVQAPRRLCGSRCESPFPGCHM